MSTPEDSWMFPNSKNTQCRDLTDKQLAESMDQS